MPFLIRKSPLLLHFSDTLFSFALLYENLCQLRVSKTKLSNFSHPKIFSEYQSVPFFSNLFGQTPRALLKITPLPAKISVLPIETSAEYLFSHSKGRLGWEKANLIYQAAKSFIRSKVVASTLEECIRNLLYELEHLEDRILFFTETSVMLQIRLRPMAINDA